MNFRVIERGMRYLEKEPRRFDMRNGICDSVGADVLQDPPCGTACCLAGAIVLSSKEGTSGLTKCHKGFPWLEVEDAAKTEVGLNSEEADKFFLQEKWPQRYANMYERAVTPKGRLRALRLFINALKSGKESLT